MVYTKIAAHLVFTALLKEQSLQQAAVFFREFIENVPNPLLHLPQGDGVGDANGSVGDGIDKSVSSRNLPALQSIMLVQDIVANRIDEGSEAFRLMDASFGEQPQNTREGLLPNVFDGRNRPQTPVHLQPNEFAEVSHKVLLGAEIAGTKPIHVGAIEILKLHWHGCTSHGLGELAFFPLPVTRSFLEEEVFAILLPKGQKVHGVV